MSIDATPGLSGALEVQSGQTTLGSGTELRTIIELTAPAMRGLGTTVWRAAGLHARYARYLGTMHQVIRASVPLLETALRRCRAMALTDDIAAALCEYLTEHIAEELDHDEWLLQDMAAAGFDPALSLGTTPPAVVARLVGPQYYWINHHDPICLLGYMAAMESNAPSAGLTDQLVAWTGLPDTAVRTVRHHAEIDGGHSSAIYDLLNRLPLTPQRRTAVRVSALATITALADLVTYVAADPTS